VLSQNSLPESPDTFRVSRQRARDSDDSTRPSANFEVGGSVERAVSRFVSGLLSRELTAKTGKHSGMGLFSRKPKVRLDEFCREFYNTQLLHPEVAGINPALMACETVKRNIAEVEPRFASVETERLMDEINIIRFEVFGLAWLHSQGDKRAAEQSEFTRRYLAEAGRIDIWEAMQPYNDASARSSILGQTSETANGRVWLAFINRMRMELFDKWKPLGFDLRAIGRAANRVGTDEAWRTNLTAGFLMCTLCARLECEVNEEAQDRLVAIIRGFYNGVAESLRSVAISG
jgi:hypothetical protein